MRFPLIRNLLAPSLLLAAASCGSVEETPPDAAPEPNLEPPVNTSSAGTVDEGGELSLASHLVSTDVDSPTQSLIYTLLSLPGDGALKLNDTDLIVGSTFTQKDVIDGNVTYVHNGTPNGGDSFDWELTDGVHMIPQSTFAVTVTPTNDAPAIVNNGTSEIAEGGTFVLTADRLSVADEEDGAITYTFVSAVRGVLQRRVGAGPFTTLVAGQTFTQQDIVDGNIRYVDPGTDDAMLAVQQNTTASFSWRVDDGQGGVAPSATGAFVSDFTITSVDDAPTIAWKTCSFQTSGTNVPANPIVSLTDPDNTLAQYSVCVVSITTGTNVTPSTTSSPGVTTLVMPTLQNGATNMAAGACLVANVLGSLNLDSAANTNRGAVTWKLMKNSIQVGANGTTQFPVSACP